MRPQTPGVYIKEISSFPPSVAGVSTAIPVFIGYTEKLPDAVEKGEEKAVRISSMVEFEENFGGPFIPDVEKIQVHLKKENGIYTFKSIHGCFYLYDAVRMFFNNGGGPCYIISLGKYKEDNTTDSNKIRNSNDIKIDYIGSGGNRGALKKFKKLDEPSLLVLPDALKCNHADYFTIQKSAIQQCSRLKDRFVILDIKEGFKSPDEEMTNEEKPIAFFRDKVGNKMLSYGAAYYPWLVPTNPSYELKFRMMKFLDQGQNEEINLDNAEFNEEKENEKEIRNDFLQSKNDIDKLFPSLGELNEFMSSDDSESLKEIESKDIAQLKEEGVVHIEEELLRLKEDIGDTADGNKTDLTRYLSLLALVLNLIRYLEKERKGDWQKEIGETIKALKQDDKLIEAIINLIQTEMDLAKIDTDNERLTVIDRDEGKVENIYSKINSTGWVENDDVFEGSNGENSFDKAGDVIEKLENSGLNKILEAFGEIYRVATGLYEQKEAILFSKHSFFKELKNHVETVPPSGAMAGIYAYMDGQEGPWLAPANVSLKGVMKPAVKLSDEEQAGLNVDPGGKSVNAIRSFMNQGTLVWGARTLDGNSNEWRYVPVRRLFLFIEKSMKKALQPFVFEPNDRNTWVKVRSMAESFLTKQWRAGALYGSKPEQAYYVAVGLGETMTNQDINNGRMIVEIGLAAVRPAEFIILRFSHKMAEA